MATSIFSIIDGLTVTKEDILEAELFSEQYLSAQFPTYDFRQGTALRDMTVRPNATLLALVNKAIKYYFDDTDLMNITNSTDPTIVDNRLSNFFINRKSGNNSVLKARLYFSFPTTKPIATIIPSSAYFSVDNDIRFTPQGSISVNPDPGILLRDPDKYYFIFDNATGSHYVDIDLVAQIPSNDSNLTEGDLLYFTLFSPYFTNGEILYLVQSAVETETNEEMVNRAYSSISTRNLINSPSIEAGISDQFNFVGEIYPVGLGNPDMYRDMITVNVIKDDIESEATYHRGGHVDVYVDTPLATQRLQLTLGPDRSATLAGAVLRMERSPESQPGKGADTLPADRDFRYATENVSRYDSEGIPLSYEDDLSLSTKQLTTLRVPFASPGDTVTMDITTYSGLNSISQAVNSEEQRVVCADYLIRSFTPVYLDISIEVRGTADVDKVTESISEYMKSIPAGGTFYMANLVSTIQEAGVYNFVMPINVEAREENRYREFDSSDSLIRDYKTFPIVDLYNIRTTQVFKTGNIELTEI